MKILQGTNEQYSDFVARLQDAVLKIVGADLASKILLQTLSFKNAYTDYQKLLKSLKANGANLNKYIKTCVSVGGAPTIYVTRSKSVVGLSVFTNEKYKKGKECTN